MHKILVINPGSTSTKFAVFEDDKQVAAYTLRHSTEEISQFKTVIDQLDYRNQMITDFLKKEGIAVADFSAVIGRGGMLTPVESGVYNVNDAMLDVLKRCVVGEHASNLGAFLAKKIAAEAGNRCRAFIADPVAVDELSDIARISGLPEIPRRSTFHALNHKAIARQHADAIGRPYEELNLVIAHMGGGITVGAHEKGRVVDVNQGLDGYGPFSPERSGTLDAHVLVQMCYSGKYTESEIMKKLAGKGGITAHLGTNDMMDLENRVAQGDEKATLIVSAMAYTIAKEITSLFAVFKGKIDGVLLTGGIAYFKYVVNEIKARVEPYVPVYVYPGEDELRSLALSALRALNGETVKEFKEKR